MSNNSKKYGKKIFVELTLKDDGATYSNFITDAQAEYAKCVKKDGEEGWVFQQFEGHLHEVLKDGKVTPTGRKWFWGIDWKQGSENYGHLYKDLGKEGKPYKVVLCSRGTWVPFDPWNIAKAVHDAVESGKGVVPNPYESSEKPAYKPVEAKANSFVPLKDADVVRKAPEENVTPVVEVPEQEDRVVMFQNTQPNKDEKNALDRLQTGDASLFVELGFPQVYAERWASQIRSGDIAVNSVEDVVNIRGIGKVRAEQLISAWDGKFGK